MHTQPSIPDPSHGRAPVATATPQFWGRGAPRRAPLAECSSALSLSPLSLWQPAQRPTPSPYSRKSRAKTRSTGFYICKPRIGVIFELSLSLLYLESARVHARYTPLPWLTMLPFCAPRCTCSRSLSRRRAPRGGVCLCWGVRATRPVHSPTIAPCGARARTAPLETRAIWVIDGRRRPTNSSLEVDGCLVIFHCLQNRGWNYILRRGVMLKLFFADQIFAQRRSLGRFSVGSCSKHLTADACLAMKTLPKKVQQNLIFF